MYAKLASIGGHDGEFLKCPAKNTKCPVKPKNFSGALIRRLISRIWGFEVNMIIGVQTSSSILVALIFFAYDSRVNL